MKDVKRKFSGAAVASVCAIVLAVGIAPPASAGSHWWNNENSHSHGTYSHGQGSIGGGLYRAYTKKLNAADLGVAIKYSFGGTIYTTSMVYASHVASITEQQIHQHRSSW
jgi:hypothetical protein